MAASTEGKTVGGPWGARATAGQEHGHLFASATVSVGQGDWASEVLSNVVGDREPVQAEPTVHAPASTATTVSPEERIRELVVEKKRLFHSQRCLELKNLPEGVTEQVRPEGAGVAHGPRCE